MARRRVTFDATQEGAAEAAVRELLGLPTPARTPDGRYAAQALPQVPELPIRLVRLTSP